MRLANGSSSNRRSSGGEPEADVEISSTTGNFAASGDMTLEAEFKRLRGVWSLLVAEAGGVIGSSVCTKNCSEERLFCILGDGLDGRGFDFERRDTCRDWRGTLSSLYKSSEETASSGRVEVPVLCVVG